MRRAVRPRRDFALSCSPHRLQSVADMSGDCTATCAYSLSPVAFVRIVWSQVVSGSSPGFLITMLDTKERSYDSTFAWSLRAALLRVEAPQSIDQPKAVVSQVST